MRFHCNRILYPTCVCVYACVCGFSGGVGGGAFALMALSEFIYIQYFRLFLEIHHDQSNVSHGIYTPDLDLPILLVVFDWNVIKNIANLNWPILN